jgi:hypothetical protein
MASSLESVSSKRLSGSHGLLGLMLLIAVVVFCCTIAVLSPDAQAYPAQLTVSISGNGVGSVNSNPPGINCVTGSVFGCQYLYSAGQTITLYATPDVRSTFAGWSGYGCTGVVNPCNIGLGDFVPNAPIATFNLKYISQVGAANYSKIQDAVDAATDGAVIDILNTSIFEDIVVNKEMILTMRGGRSDDFNSTTGSTTIHGSLSINCGTVVVMDIVIS